MGGNLLAEGKYINSGEGCGAIGKGKYDPFFPAFPPIHTLALFVLGGSVTKFLRNQKFIPFFLLLFLLFEVVPAVLQASGIFMPRTNWEMRVVK